MFQTKLRHRSRSFDREVQQQYPDRAPKQNSPPVDFAAVIEGYDEMTAALRLRAKTRYMLQQVTTPAEHSDGQWTRFKFDPHANDDRDVELDVAELKGHKFSANNADAQHEAAIFGLTDNRSRHMHHSAEKEVSTAASLSSSDGDDPPQVDNVFHD